MRPALDQIRWDVAIDLLQGSQISESADGGMVNVTITAETLIGISNQPGEFDCYGQVIAEIGRKDSPRQVDGPMDFHGHRQRSALCHRHPQTPTQQCSEAASPSQLPHLCVPRLPSTRPECDLDHRRPFLPGWAYLQRQPRAALPLSPHGPTPRTVAAATTARW